MKSRVLFVGNINFSTTSEQLREYFSEAGNVDEIYIPQKYGKNAGYSFIIMRTPEEAERAVEMFDRKELDGRMIGVEISQKNPSEFSKYSTPKPKTQEIKMNQRRTFRSFRGSGTATPSSFSSFQPRSKQIMIRNFPVTASMLDLQLCFKGFSIRKALILGQSYPEGDITSCFVEFSSENEVEQILGGHKTFKIDPFVLDIIISPRKINEIL
ncbi:putative RNA recognition motif protein [Monocercomonoides exilis]|uniref:putative RNA recognition motif protein n=1 Tax=Monocercomonoides exilis TaxID=2049356 RepID=UPI0035597B1E|nr:putative RNA recognition motif protein [Monocercomonoides exilis]